MEPTNVPAVRSLDLSTERREDGPAVRGSIRAWTVGGLAGRMRSSEPATRVRGAALLGDP